MTVKELRTLVDNLDEYIHVPGGIKRLKKIVLHLAVSGQLVPQDPSEGTGEELYQKIQAEKEKLVTEGKLKKQKPFPKISDSEIPFKTPANWKWVRLGEILTIERGGSPRPIKEYLTSNQKGLNWIKIGDSDIGGRYITSTREKIKPEGLRKTRLVHEGDLILSNSMSYGRPYILKIDGCIHDGWLLLRDESRKTYSEFLYYLLFSDLCMKQFSSKTSGAVVQNLNSNKVRDVIVPIMPPEEQHRIVKRIDELYKLIDELTEKYKAEQSERKKLVTSSLAKLSRRESDLALKHISEIIRTKSDAAELRKTILHLAVSGKLVPQDPSESTGGELYNQILQEKEKLIAEGKLKKSKPLQKIASGEIPFEIPENWKWVRLPDIYRNVTPVTKVKTSDIHKSGKYPVIDQGQRYIAGYVNTGKLNKVEMAVTIFGDHTREIKQVDFDFIVGADGVKILEPISTDSNFFYLLIDVFRPESRGYGRHFKMLNEKVVPLPPISEQIRIVKKTTQLLDLVSELEKHLEG